MKYEIRQTLNDLEDGEATLRLIPETPEEAKIFSDMNSELKDIAGNEYVLNFFSESNLPNGNPLFLDYRVKRKKAK